MGLLQVLMQRLSAGRGRYSPDVFLIVFEGMDFLVPALAFSLNANRMLVIKAIRPDLAASVVVGQAQRLFAASHMIIPGI